MPSCGLQVAQGRGGSHLCAPYLGSDPDALAPTSVLIRADGHYAVTELLSWCRGWRGFILVLPRNTALQHHVQALEQSTAAKVAGTDKVRRYKKVQDAASAGGRIIARVDAGPQRPFCNSASRHARTPTPTALDLPGECGEHRLRNQEVLYGKREQTDAGVST